MLVISFLSCRVTPTRYRFVTVVSSCALLGNRMAGDLFFKLPCNIRPESFWKREVFIRQSHGWCFLFQVCLATGPAHGWCCGFYLMTCNIFNFKTLNPKQKTVDNLLGVTNILSHVPTVCVLRCFGPRTVTFFCPSHGVWTLYVTSASMHWVDIVT